MTVVFMVLIMTGFKVIIKDCSKTAALFYFNDLEKSEGIIVNNNNKVYKIIIKTN
jgi:hypothetical protein